MKRPVLPRGLPCLFSLRGRALKRVFCQTPLHRDCAVTRPAPQVGSSAHVGSAAPKGSVSGFWVPLSSSGSCRSPCARALHVLGAEDFRSLFRSLLAVQGRSHRTIRRSDEGTGLSTVSVESVWTRASWRIVHKRCQVFQTKAFLRRAPGFEALVSGG